MPFWSNNLGKPGIVREVPIIFIQVREKSGKTNCLVYLSFSLTRALLFAKCLFHLLSVNVNYTLHGAIASICTLPIY